MVWVTEAILKLYLQSEIEKQWSDILKLGLLHGDMSPERAHIQQQRQWLTFPNRIFQDYLSAYYIVKLGKVSVSSGSSESRKHKIFSITYFYRVEE